MRFDLSLRISSFHSLYVCYISHVLITFVFHEKSFVDLLSSFLQAIFFFYALSCMLACISIAVVYMLFVLGMFTKSCLFKCTQINCLVPLFFLCWACVLLKAPTLFDIVKVGVYLIMIVVSCMKFGCHVYAHVYGY